jgi:hypothetical protein
LDATLLDPTADGFVVGRRRFPSGHAEDLLDGHTAARRVVRLDDDRDPLIFRQVDWPNRLEYAALINGFDGRGHGIFSHRSIPPRRADGFAGVSGGSVLSLLAGEQWRAS